MKKQIITIMLALLAVTVNAAKVTPSKKYVTQTLKTGSFMALRTNTSIDIEYSVGPQSVKLYAPDNLIEYIKVSLVNGELVVNYKENMQINGDHKSRLIVTAPVVTKFTTASSGDITINSNISLTGDEVEFSVLSAGDIEALDVTAKKITFKTNSAGDIEAKNLSATDIKFVVNSAGDIEAQNAKASNEITLVTNSAGDISLASATAAVSVSVASNSAGDVEIDKLSAENLSAKANSSGDLHFDYVEVDEVKATSNSAGEIKISGICDNASLSSYSTGEVDAVGLKAISVVAYVGSIGDVICYPLKSLDATRKGNGNIRFENTPNTLTKNDNGRGNGIKKN